jgi:hypothetical protein
MKIIIGYYISNQVHKTLMPCIILHIVYRMFVGVIIWFFSLVSVFTKLKM